MRSRRGWARMMRQVCGQNKRRGNRPQIRATSGPIWLPRPLCTHTSHLITYTHIRVVPITFPYRLERSHCPSFRRAPRLITSARTDHKLRETQRGNYNDLGRIIRSYVVVMTREILQLVVDTLVQGMNRHCYALFEQSTRRVANRKRLITGEACLPRPKTLACLRQSW